MKTKPSFIRRSRGALAGALAALTAWGPGAAYSQVLLGSAMRPEAPAAAAGVVAPGGAALPPLAGALDLLPSWIVSPAAEPEYSSGAGRDTQAPALAAAPPEAPASAAAPVQEDEPLRPEEAPAPAAGGALAGLRLPLPRFSSMGSVEAAAAARGDFAARAGAEEAGAPAELVVLLGDDRPLTRDFHLGWIGSRSGEVGAYAEAREKMLAQLEAAGLPAASLAAHAAAPVATYRRINAATLRVSAPRREDLRLALAGRGFKVFDNERRELVRPIVEDSRRGQPVSMERTLALSGMDRLHALARRHWGRPPSARLGRLGRAALAASYLLFRAGIPQPPVAVIDTGVDKSHPLIAHGLKASKDVRPRGDGADDNGHGSWVTSMVLCFAPWLRGLTHYKALRDGSGTLDYILKALTQAANDGSIIISNSWGSDVGDPEAPDSLLVRKLAEEGHVLVFAAGNDGYAGPNTIGSPAIVSYRDPATGAPRVLAVASTGPDLRPSPFSSRGPGSPVTSAGGRWLGYPRKPDLAEEGERTEAAWPGGMGPDRVDRRKGPLRAISGTSMATPKVAGALAMLAMVFGVTSVGPRLDALVAAYVAGLRKAHGGEAAVGGGFPALWAAYEAALEMGLRPVWSGHAARASARLADFFLG